MKTKYVGRKTLNDPETGESYDFDIISKNYDEMDSKGWRRVIMGDLMEAIEQIGNQKIKVLEFIVDNMDDKNQITLSYRAIQEKTKISLRTITATFKSLKEANLLKKHNKVYVLNTTIISAYGSTEKNAYLTIEYNFTKKSLVKDKKEKLRKIEEIEKENLKQKKELAKKERELAKQQEELEKLRELLKKQEDKK